MKVETINEEDHLKLLSTILQREKQESLASAALTSEILSKLGISVEALPQKHQQLLRQSANWHLMDINPLDPISISLRQSKELSEKLSEDYEILKLKQKNAELQAKIDHNDQFLKSLRKELQCSRDSLASQTPNPDNIQEYIRQLKQKVASYEENCDKITAKFSKLSVPEALYPKALSSVATSLETLQETAEGLRRRAEDVSLAREVRNTFHRLRR